MKKAILTALVTAMAALGAAQAQAAGLGGLTRGLSQAPAVHFIKVRQPTLAPFAHVRFCMQNPDECRPGDGPMMVTLTSSASRTLQAVNNSINREIVGVNDSSDSDDWEVNVKRGDCEDFALTKRDRLIAAGISARSLRIAVATTPSGEGHAVLVVKTTRGDLVLDNRTDRIKDWRETDLRWVKIQSGENPRMWYDI